MTIMDRRRMLETVLGGLVAATAAVALVPTAAEAGALAMGGSRPVAGGSPDELPIVPVHTGRCRVRRKVRVWSRGRYINTWRWVWVRC